MTGVASAEAAKAAVTKIATLENIVNEVIDEVGAFRLKRGRCQVIHFIELKVQQGEGRYSEKQCVGERIMKAARVWNNREDGKKLMPSSLISFLYVLVPEAM
jgi:hypothetical protein